MTVRLAQLRELGERALKEGKLTQVEFLEVMRANERGVLTRGFVQEMLRGSTEWSEFRRRVLWLEEEQVSQAAYPAKYQGPKPIAEQAHIFRCQFLWLCEVDLNLGDRPLVERAEGNFVIPLWQKVASTYQHALELVIDRLEARHAVDLHEGRIGPRHLRRSERTEQMLKALSEQQKGRDFLVVPAQFGRRHCGKSARRTREVFEQNEFGLGAFEVGCMLLAHPERLATFGDPSVDCAGDQYNGGWCSVGDPWAEVPFWLLNHEDPIVEFGTRYAGNVHENTGSVTAFLP